MTSYLYAPKDDCKHRAFWRELYTVEEAEHLQERTLDILTRAIFVQEKKNIFLFMPYNFMPHEYFEELPKYRNLSPISILLNIKEWSFHC